MKQKVFLQYKKFDGQTFYFADIQRFTNWKKNDFRARKPKV